MNSFVFSCSTHARFNDRSPRWFNFVAVRACGICVVFFRRSLRVSAARLAPALLAFSLNGSTLFGPHVETLEGWWG